MLAVAGGFVVAIPSTSSAGVGGRLARRGARRACRGGHPDRLQRLRHGTTPELADDLAVVVTDPSGSYHRFQAAQQGAPGHYVATITLPEEGRAQLEGDGHVRRCRTWQPRRHLERRWCAERGRGCRRVGTASLAAVMTGAAVLDFRRTRRDRRTAAVPPDAAPSGLRRRGNRRRRPSLLAAAVRLTPARRSRRSTASQLFTTKGSRRANPAPDGISMIGVVTVAADAPSSAGERVTAVGRGRRRTVDAATRRVRSADQPVVLVEPTRHAVAPTLRRRDRRHRRLPARTSRPTRSVRTDVSRATITVSSRGPGGRRRCRWRAAHRHRRSGAAPRHRGAGDPFDADDVVVGRRAAGWRAIMTFDRLGFAAVRCASWRTWHGDHRRAGGARRRAELRAGGRRTAAPMWSAKRSRRPSATSSWRRSTASPYEERVVTVCVTSSSLSEQETADVLDVPPGTVKSCRCGRWRSRAPSWRIEAFWRCLHVSRG